MMTNKNRPKARACSGRLIKTPHCTIQFDKSKQFLKFIKNYSSKSLNFPPHIKQKGAFLKKVTEATSARAQMEEKDPVWFAAPEGEVLLFSE
jgi:hypothetical protein